MGQGAIGRSIISCTRRSMFFEDACVKRVENEAENYARLWRIVLKHDQ